MAMNACNYSKLCVHHDSFCDHRSIASVISYTNSLKFTSQNEQLNNIMSQLSAKAIEVVNLLSQENSSAQAFVDLPNSIGNQQYWLRFQNDSVSAWMYGGLGDKVQETGPGQIFLPQGLDIQGNFVSGYGSAILEASRNGSTIMLYLMNNGD